MNDNNQPSSHKSQHEIVEQILECAEGQEERDTAREVHGTEAHI